MLQQCRYKAGAHAFPSLSLLGFATAAVRRSGHHADVWKSQDQRQLTDLPHKQEILWSCIVICSLFLTLPVELYIVQCKIKTFVILSVYYHAITLIVCCFFWFHLEHLKFFFFRDKIFEYIVKALRI